MNAFDIFIADFSVHMPVEHIKEDKKMERFESVIENVSDMEVKVYEDPVEGSYNLEIWAKSGKEECVYKFKGPGVRVANFPMFDEWINLAKDNEKLKQENKKLKEAYEKLKQERSKIPMVDDCLKLSKEIEKLTFEKEMMKKGNEKFKKVNERLRNENQELKKDLQELKEAFPMTVNKILYGKGELKVEKEDTDNVNHPSHYETGKFECIEVMQEVFGIGAVINFCKCNAFKYVYRMDRKNGTDDAKKAIWYLNKYLELQDELVSELFDDGGERDGERHKDE